MCVLQAIIIQCIGEWDDDDIAMSEPGPLCHFRWFTLAQRILCLDVHTACPCFALRDHGGKTVHACSRVFTRVHACSRVFTRVHACSRVFTRVHACSRVFTRVHAAVLEKSTAACFCVPLHDIPCICAPVNTNLLLITGGPLSVCFVRWFNVDKKTRRRDKGMNGL